MTYYFSGIDELLLEAFSSFTEIMSRQYQAFFSDVSDAQGACRAITDMIHSSQVATPDNMELMYQLYALAAETAIKNGNAKLMEAQSANARTMV